MTRNNVKVLLFYFTAYYFAQGVYNAYGVFEQPYLRSNGIGLADVSVSKAVAKVPWSVKILMAIPTDYIGRRLPFATGGMIAGATCLAVISSFNPGSNYPLYVGTVFMRNLGIAFSDVAVDGMSVDSNLDSMAGTVQGFMSAGRVIGTLIGSSIGAPIVGKLGYGPMILFLAGIIFSVIPVNCFVKEEKASQEKFEWIAFKELLRPSVLCLLAYACIGNLSGALGGTASTEWAQTVVGLSAEDLGYVATVATVGDLIGAIGTGFLFDRYDRRWVMTAAAALSCVLGLSAIYTTSREGWYALNFFSGVTSGSLFVTECGSVMVLADKRLGASVFAIAVSLMNFSSLIGDAIGGPLAENYPLTVALWASFVVNLLQIPFVPYIVPTANASGTNPVGQDTDNDITDKPVTVVNILRSGAEDGSSQELNLLKDGGVGPEISDRTAAEVTAIAAISFVNSAAGLTSNRFVQQPVPGTNRDSAATSRRLEQLQGMTAGAPSPPRLLREWGVAGGLSSPQVGQGLGQEQAGMSVIPNPYAWESTSSAKQAPGAGTNPGSRQGRVKTMQGPQLAPVQEQDDD